jgi:hypothetical protein
MNDAAFANDPDWIAGAQEAIAESEAGQGQYFPSTEAFVRHLRGVDVEDETATQSDESSFSPNDAHLR